MVWLAGEAAFYASLNPPEFDRSDAAGRNLLLHYGRASNVHYFRGTLFQLKKELDAAKEEYREELRISPQHVPAMVDLARVYVDEKQFTQAISMAKRAAEVEPKNASARDILGQVLLVTGNLPESARELETAQQLAPDSASIRLHLATVYRKLSRNKEAQEELGHRSRSRGDKTS
jgi:tetratricopeptide (TPR) repeat protein